MKYKILVMVTVSVVCVMALKQSFGLTPIGCMGRICETGGTVVAQGTNCATSTRTCYDNQAVISCNTCNSGVTRTAKTVSVDLCEEPVTYYTCSSGGGSGSGIMCTPTYCAAGANITMRGQNCSSYASATCLDSPSGGHQGVESCATCKSGYEKSTTAVTVSGCSNTLSFTTCVKTCNGTCTDCNDTNWTSGTPIQSRVDATCNTLTCVCSKKTEYRCVGGYYGTPTNGLTGCTKCPDGGLSTAGMNSNITNCYITGGSDASGTFVFDRGHSSMVGNNWCYYSN